MANPTSKRALKAQAMANLTLKRETFKAAAELFAQHGCASNFLLLQNAALAVQDAENAVYWARQGFVEVGVKMVRAAY